MVLTSLFGVYATNAKSTKDLCERLIERLRSAGLVTHIWREHRLTQTPVLPNA
jgi:hypothetical protein